MGRAEKSELCSSKTESSLPGARVHCPGTRPVPGLSAGRRQPPAGRAWEPEGGGGGGRCECIVQAPCQCQVRVRGGVDGHQNALESQRGVRVRRGEGGEAGGIGAPAGALITPPLLTLITHRSDGRRQGGFFALQWTACAHIAVHHQHGQCGFLQAVVAEGRVGGGRH